MHAVHEKIVLLLLIVLFLSWFIQAVYYLGVYIRLPLYKTPSRDHGTRAVSVIVCAKNERKNLEKYLPVFLEQVYPDYEVIVVDDCSWDDSAAYLEEVQKKYSHLKVVSLKEQERYRHGKKFALTLGIKAAKNEWLLFADADCLPAGKNWLAQMQDCFGEKTDIVLGYGAFHKEKGMLNKFIRFDAFFVAVNYFSFALTGRPYMGVGRNLAYRKSLFFRVKGFAKHNHVVSGDDDLFVNENATPENTLIEIQPESFTYSDAKKTFADWYRQKLRHTSSGKYYKANHKWMLFTQPFFNALFFLSLIALLIVGYKWQVVAIAYVAMLLLKVAVLIPSARKLQEKDLTWLFPVFEPVLLAVHSSLFIANLFRKQKLWK
jgi:biofilm PGA synthesis N-glycosyltransferase PgaC